MKDLPYFIDVEASSLESESYPTEIAWSDSNGKITSYLINPYYFDDWNDWDYHAQQITGISRKLCREEGFMPPLVCEKMNEALEGQTLYTDGYESDSFWINKLFNDCAIKPKFHLQFLDVVLKELPLDCRLQFTFDVQHHKAEYGCHRAGKDVNALVQIWIKYLNKDEVK